jgi:Family of unknown function (DUF6069)
MPATMYRQAIRPASPRRAAATVAVAAAAALVIWAVVRLLGVELTVDSGDGTAQVGPVDVLVATVLAGLAAWAVQRLLARRARTSRWWPSIGSIALAVSMIGPGNLAVGAAAAMALMCLHLATGAVLIKGLSAPGTRWAEPVGG